jgi:hypothetical protein
MDVERGVRMKFLPVKVPRRQNSLFLKTKGRHTSIDVERGTSPSWKERKDSVRRQVRVESMGILTYSGRPQYSTRSESKELVSVESLK